jgi:hypothetical protein
MTNTYDTSNEPLGSKAPKVLYNNASNFDEAMNSTSPSFNDRFGIRRQTWFGAEYEWQQMLVNSGFEPIHLVYTDGSPLVVSRPTQLIDRAGISYRVKLPVVGGFPVTLTGTWATDQVQLVDVADAALRQDLAASTGATLIKDGTKTVSQKLAVIRRKTIDEYAVPGQTNWDAAFAAARADFDASATPMELVFPAGVYTYTQPVNWAKQDCAVIAEGEVRLRYSGSGVGFQLDAGTAPTDLVYNMTVGPFIIEAPASATDGAFIRSIHHSDIHLINRGAGSTSAGIRINFAVCNVLKIACTVNQEGWYLGAKPQYGLVLDIRNANEQVAYNTFINPIIEGPTDGIRMPGALGNTFLGGTSEACTNGVIVGPASYANKFYGLDLEANITVDILCQGYGNDFINVDSDLYCLFDGTSHSNQVLGGNFKNLQLLPASHGNLVSGARINRSNNGGVLDLAGDNRNINCFNSGTGAWIADVTGPQGSQAFSASIPNNTDAIATIAATSARLGMYVDWSYAGPLAGLEVTAWVDSNDVVKVRFVNRTGVTQSLGGALLKVRCHL